MNRFAMDHAYPDTGPYLYPNGFPLLLLPVYAIFGMNLWVLKLYCWLFFVAAIPLVYGIFRQEKIPPLQALLISLLIGFNYHFIRFSDNILSDLPFFFFSCLSIFLIQKSAVHKMLQATGLGILLFFTYSIRDIGILLFIVLAIYQWKYFKSDQKTNWIAIFIPYILFIILWFVIHAMAPSGGEKHLAMLFGTSLEIVTNNIYGYWLLMGNYFMLFRGIPNILQWTIATGFTIIIVIGMYKQGLHKKHWLLYVLATFGLYFIWVTFMGMRFIFPILPFIVFYTVKGLQVILKKESWQKIALSLLLVSTIAQSLFVCYYYWNKDTNEAYTTDLQEVYEYIREELPQDAIIVFHKPRALRLFTGRNAVHRHRHISSNKFEVMPTHKAPDNYLLQNKSYTLIKL